MKTTLNELILELFKNKNPKVIETKVSLWKEELFAEKQNQLRLKDLYMQQHENPRKDYEIAASSYLEEISRLRKNYSQSTDLTMKGNLYKWINGFANIPEILYTPKSQVYTSIDSVST